MEMTREEAIKNIKEHCYFANLIPQAKEALDMAIKVLEQKPCEDAISRADAIDLFGHGREWTEQEAQEAIRSLPTARSICQRQQNDVPDTNVGKMDCRDAISREDALMALTGEWDEKSDEIIHRFIKRIRDLPRVKPVGLIATVRFDEEKLKEIVKDRLRTVFDTESYASEDGGDLIRYEDAVGAVEELDFVQPKKTVGKLISVDVLDKIITDIQKLRGCSCSCSDGIIDDVEDIIDKYKAGSEEA